MQPGKNSHIIRRGALDEDGSATTRSRSEYHLTAAGADTLPVLHALAGWGNRHTDAPKGPMRILHRDCGLEASSADRCDTCGVALTTENVAWDRPSHAGHPVTLEGAR